MRLNDDWWTVFQIEDHLQFLHTSYRDIVTEKHQLASRKKLATKRLQCASVLLTVLEDEMVWLPLAFLFPLLVLMGFNKPEKKKKGSPPLSLRQQRVRSFVCAEAQGNLSGTAS